MSHVFDNNALEEKEREGKSCRSKVTGRITCVCFKRVDWTECEK